MTAYGLSVEIAVDGDNSEGALQRFAVAFERAGDAVADWGRYVFPKLEPVFEKQVKAQMDGEGVGPAGSYAPLSPSYEEWKSRSAPGMPILELSGVMKAALTDGASPQAWRQWSATDFSFGTFGVEYASFHQTGTGKMPRRPLFDFGGDFDRALTTVALAGLREAIKAASSGHLDLEGAP